MAGRFGAGFRRRGCAKRRSGGTLFGAVASDRCGPNSTKARSSIFQSIGESHAQVGMLARVLLLQPADILELPSDSRQGLQSGDRDLLPCRTTGLERCLRDRKLRAEHEYRVERGGQPTAKASRAETARSDSAHLRSPLREGVAPKKQARAEAGLQVGLRFGLATRQLLPSFSSVRSMKPGGNEERASMRVCGPIHFQIELHSASKQLSLFEF